MNKSTNLIDQINQEATNLTDGYHSTYFNLRTARQRVIDGQNMPAAELIFDQFFVEHEIGILFAPVNAGKSIAAAQIAEMLSTGKPIGGFSMTAAKQKVIYYELELSDRQFAKRVDGFNLDDNFVTATMDVSFSEVEDVEEFSKKQLDEVMNIAERYDFDTLIIDNLTWLLQDAEKGKTARSFMQRLWKFQRRTNKSILVVSHTPKRDISAPILIYDLYGSSMLSNFTDHAFCIVESNSEPGVRYIKQVKVRSAEKKYHIENVVIAELISESGKLYFKNIGTDNEYNHLKRVNAEVRNERSEKILELSDNGKTKKEIAAELKISERTVYRTLKN